MANEIGGIGAASSVEYTQSGAIETGGEQQEEILINPDNNSAGLTYTEQEEQSVLDVFNNEANEVFSKEKKTIAKNDELIKDAKKSGHRGATVYRDEQGRTLRMEKDVEMSPGQQISRTLKNLVGLSDKSVDTEHRQTDYEYTTDENGNQIKTEVYSVDGKIQYTTKEKYDENGKISESTRTEADGSTSSTKYKYNENGNLVGRYVDKDNDGHIDSYYTDNKEYVYLNSDNIPDLLNIKTSDVGTFGQTIQNTYLSNSFFGDMLGSATGLFMPKAYAANNETELPDVENLSPDDFHDMQILQQVRNIDGSFGL